MRRVDWPIVMGPGSYAGLTQRPSRGAISVLSAADELVSYPDLDTVTRRAVELARDRLALERVALFLAGADDQLYGTFGTGRMGETTDERDIVFAAGESHHLAMAQSRSGISRWVVLDDVPLLAQSQDRTVVVGRGWNVLTPVRSRQGFLGFFVNDCALSGAPLDERKQGELAVFGTILGNLLELKRRDACTVSGPVAVTAARPGRLSRDVEAVIARMRQEPNVSTADLARAAHVTPRSLAKHFRSQVGVALVDYRNRIRVERFLWRMEQSDANCLEAAIDAGFGSYAQFHRVFRDLLGTTPKEYLASRHR